MKDNYMHKEMDIFYITESIPGPREHSLDYDILLGNYNSQMLDKCRCHRHCLKSDCKCLQLSQGENYTRVDTHGGDELKKDLKFNVKASLFRDYPILECNSNCQCPADCGNRVVQHGPIEGLIVKHCENQDKGLGLFTSNFIVKDTFICEYAGELLTKSQVLQRSKENEEQGKMNYIFCLNEHTHDEGFVQTFVDPSKFGNIGRYINHSCEPNCRVVPVRYEIATPRLAIFANTHIKPGEEITFSYGTGNLDNSTLISFDQRDSDVLSKQKKCLCNSKNCIGYMPLQNFE